MDARPALISLVPPEAIAKSDGRDQATDNDQQQPMNNLKNGRAESLDPQDQELLHKAASGIRLRGM